MRVRAYKILGETICVMQQLLVEMEAGERDKRDDSNTDWVDIFYLLSHIINLPYLHKPDKFTEGGALHCFETLPLNVECGQFGIINKIELIWPQLNSWCDLLSIAADFYHIWPSLKSEFPGPWQGHDYVRFIPQWFIL